MSRNSIYGMVLWLFFSPLSYAVNTYFPGDGGPNAVDIETKPPQYYPPQNAQPDPDEEPYNNPNNDSDFNQSLQKSPGPTQPISPNVTSPTNEGSWGR